MPKVLRFLPLAFIAGQHGLVIFVSYLFAAFVVWQVIRPFLWFFRGSPVV